MSSPQTLAVLLACLGVASGCRRHAPPGSGTVETTGERAGDASAARAPSVSTFPGGAILIGDAGACTVARYASTSESAVWSFVIPQCGGVLETAIALDSVAYARTRRALVAINADGKEIWRLTLNDSEPLPPELLAVATTLDSRVVLATSVRSIVAYKNDSAEAWRFGFTDEVLVSPPVASRGSGVFLVTNQALYNLAADGTLRFRRSLVTASQ